MELTCIHEPGRLLSFLQSQNAIPTARGIELCRAYSVDDALAFLLEQIGEVEAAVDHLCQVRVTRVAFMKQHRRIIYRFTASTCGYEVLETVCYVCYNIYL
jgi:hypothetical protein